MLHFVRTNRRLMGLWILPLFMAAWFTMTCADCLDHVGGESHEYVAGMSGHNCCNGNMDDSTSPGSDLACETACAEVADVSNGNDFYVATLDADKLNYGIPSEQYYLFLQNNSAFHADRLNREAIYNPDLPEKNRILLI